MQKRKIGNVKKYTNQVLKNIVPGDEISLTVEFNEIGLKIALFRVIEN